MPDVIFEVLAVIVVRAWKQYGKAGIRLLCRGDCCGYALAKYLNEPRLFKGDHFADTDIVQLIV